MLRKLFLLTVWVLGNGLAIWGQCPAKDSLWNSVQRLAAADITPDAQLNQLHMLRESFKNCPAMPDSAVAFLYQRMGVMYFLKNDFKTAVDTTILALKMLNHQQKSATSSNAQKIKCFHNLSIYYDSLGDQAKRFEYTDSCIHLGLNANQGDSLVLYLICDKMIYLMNLGDYVRVVEYGTLGERFAIQFGFTKTYINKRIFSWKVNSLRLLKDYPAMANELKNKIQEYQQSGSPGYTGNLYSLWADYYLGIKAYDSALNCYRQAFNIERTVYNPGGCAAALSNSGLIYSKYLQNDRKALELYKQALDFAHPSASVGILDNIGNVFAAKNQYDSAFFYYAKGMNQISPGLTETGLLNKLKAGYTANMSDYIVTLLLDKTDALMNEFKWGGQKKKLDEAITSYKNTDLLLNIVRQNQFELKSKLFWRESVRRLYEHGIEACWLKKDAALGFYFFEKSRAVLLDDQLKQERLEKGLKTKEPADASATAEHIPDIQSLRKSLLNGHTTLFEIFNGDSSVFTLTLSVSAAAISRISKQDFDSLSESYLSLISSQDSMLRQFPRFTKISNHLYHLLFGNISIPSGRLIISPDGPFFPFEALVSRETDTHYMLSDYSISYTYSARFLTSYFASDNPTKGRDFMGMAPVHYVWNPELSSLPGSNISLGLISSYFKDAQTFSEKLASKNNFLHTFSDYRIVQLYSHAAYNGGDWEPVIYFADSALPLSDLAAGYEPATRLMVLSACETALGQDYKGEGIFSFCRQFATLGIPASVSNLWSVDNESTYRITELFYEGISKGLPTDIALQQAKLRFLQTASGEKTLPYFWAASILTGKPESIQTLSPFPVWTIYLLAAMAMSVAVISFLIKPSWFRSQTPRQ